MALPVHRRRDRGTGRRRPRRPAHRGYRLALPDRRRPPPHKLDANRPIHARFRSVLHTSAPATFALDTLPADSQAYRGEPVIYVIDRLQQKNRKILCGTEPLLGDHHPPNTLLRVAPREYRFSSDRKEDTTAIVNAEPDTRYLVYHDRQGLHELPLTDRPDLLDALPEITEKTVFLFDVANLDPTSRDAMNRDMARGGCGAVKVLHTRTGPPEPAKKP